MATLKRMSVPTSPQRAQVGKQSISSEGGEEAKEDTSRIDRNRGPVRSLGSELRKLFSEVVRQECTIRGEPSQRAAGLKRMKINGKQLNVEWLDGVYVGKVQDMEVLISAQNIDLLHSAVLDGGELVTKWLADIRPWKDSVVCSNRLVWLQCSEVPLYARGMFFFARLASFWGTLVYLDECTRKRESLHRARLLVLTHEIESIADSVQVEVNGHTFSIKVVEDPNGTYMWPEK
ncbi:hypothetical protein Ancab_006576, partial [Ancistrocladus abbreviatus]